MSFHPSFHRGSRARWATCSLCPGWQRRGGSFSVAAGLTRDREAEKTMMSQENQTQSRPLNLCNLKEKMMLTRRQTVLGAAIGTTIPLGVACAANPDYDGAVKSLWRHSSEKPADAPALMRELVRYATLAPSSHNTQCWRFRIQESAILIEPDLTRRTPVVDPDDHHLWVSLGCAAENLAQAALANGLKAEALVTTAGTGGVAVSLEPTQPAASALYQAIVDRQCTRGDYDGKPVSLDELRLLEQAGSGKGVRLKLLTERPALEKVLEYIVAGSDAQVRDPAFVNELKAWIRFGKSQAVQAGDGLFSGSSGNPSLPTWLGRPVMGLFFTEKAEREKYTRQIRNSSGVAVFVSDANDKAHWAEAGRCYERFALQATALGIRNAFLNQPVEVSTIRPQFAAWLGVGNARVDLVVRFGRGPKMPSSLRRPVQAVLI
jgi:hypothetical protein